MAFKYTGDAILGVSLTVETPKPLDTRTVVNNLTELYSIPEKYAYQGMTVSNIDNGNIYMLIDKSKIKYKEGWKASYESILIITCTEAEYKEWANNTNDDFTPKDPDKTYLHSETYYYIYEESIENKDLFYLSAEWGRNIEEQLKEKALNTTVVQIRNDLDLTILNLSNYATLEELTTNYVPKTDLDLANSESFISKTLSNYYTKSETDDIFVTKESLRGEGIEGDDFVFVTKKLYDEDQQVVLNELDKTLKVDGNGSLESITVGLIKSPENLLVVDVKSEGLFVGKDKFALISEVPKIITLTEEEYLQLVETDSTEPDVYYYVYDITDDAKTYITKGYLDLNYHTINQYLSWIALNYYSKTQIDEIIANYVTVEDIKTYYTIQQIDDKFLTKTDAESTYATKLSVTDLNTVLERDYVTKDDLRGDSPATGDDDFIFVTLTTYLNDKTAAAQKIKTNLLEAPTVNVNGINITSENSRLLAEGKLIAFTEEVPKLVCLPLTEYDNLLENNNTETDTYYYTYGKENTQDTGYVRSEYLTEHYYTKAEVENLIQAAIENLLKSINK